MSRCHFPLPVLVFFLPFLYTSVTYSCIPMPVPQFSCALSASGSFSLGFSQTFLCLPFVARSFDLGFWTCRFIINSHLYFFYLPALPVSTFGSSLLCSSLHYGSFKCIIVSPLAETVLVWVSDSMLKYH